MQSNVVADLPSKQRMLVGGIVADNKNSGRVVDLTHAGCGFRIATQGSRESREVRGAVMVHVVGLKNDAGKFREQVIFFVGGARGADHADGLTTVLSRISAKLCPIRLKASSHVEGVR